MDPWQQQPDANGGHPHPGGPPRPHPQQPPASQPYPQQQPYPYPEQPYPQQQYPAPPFGPPQQYQPPQYQPQQYPPQQYPGQPYPGQPYPGYPPYPPQPVSSGAAITSIALSLLIALLQAFAFIGYLAVASDLSSEGNAIRGWVPTFLVVMGIARLLVALGLVVGAVLLIRRSPLGRTVTAGTAVAVVILQFVEYGVRSSALPTSGANPFSTLISVVLPIALTIFVLTSATRRWVDAGPQRR